MKINEEDLFAATFVADKVEDDLFVVTALVDKVEDNIAVFIGDVDIKGKRANVAFFDGDIIIVVLWVVVFALILDDGIEKFIDVAVTLFIEE